MTLLAMNNINTQYTAHRISNLKNNTINYTSNSSHHDNLSYHSDYNNISQEHNLSVIFSIIPTNKENNNHTIITRFKINIIHEFSLEQSTCKEKN